MKNFNKDIEDVKNKTNNLFTFWVLQSTGRDNMLLSSIH